MQLQPHHRRLPKPAAKVFLQSASNIFTHDLMRQRKRRSCCPIVIRGLTWSMICKGDWESMSCASFGQSSTSARAEAVWGFSNVLVAFVTCKVPGSVTNIPLLSFDRLWDSDCQDRVCLKLWVSKAAPYLLSSPSLGKRLSWASATYCLAAVATTSQIWCFSAAKQATLPRNETGSHLRLQIVASHKSAKLLQALETVSPNFSEARSQSHGFELKVRVDFLD